VTAVMLGFFGLCLAGASVLAIVGLLDRRGEQLGRVTPGTLRRYSSNKQGEQ
jgi:hypothetical protein